MSKIPIISSRKNFFKRGVISNKDKARMVNLADPRPTNCKIISISDISNLSKDKEIYILMHGYNNSFTELADAYLKISNLLQSSGVNYGQLIGYVWPGGYMGMLSYLAAKRSAKQLSERMAGFIDEIGGSASKVNIVAHSLGCFLALLAMKKMLSNVSNIYLLAPAVSNKALLPNQIFSSGLKRADLIYVFKSSDDMVLKWGFRAAEFGHKALGFTGSDPFQQVWHRTVEVDCSNQTPVISHSEYLHRSEIFDFIANNPVVENIPAQLILRSKLLRK